MPQFVMYCIDGEKGAELRPQIRERHLTHVRDSGLVRFASVDIRPFSMSYIDMPRAA